RAVCLDEFLVHGRMLSPATPRFGWNVWLVLRLATLLCSVIGSCWLLRAAWKPSYLFTRQLRHLAVADLGLSLVAPGYELGMWLMPGLPKHIGYFSQSCFRGFLCSSCFIETQIAAGVMGSALRWQRCPKALASTLIISWVSAAGIGVGDVLSTHFSETDTFAVVVAVVLCTTVLLSFLMYLISILAVLWTPSPSAVVRRASQRALAFPCSFLITVFPQWLLYVGLAPKDWFRHVATIAVYSNGCVNAAVYSWQNRHICSTVDWRTWRARNGRSLRQDDSHSSLAQSFHVGFGRVSRLFPQTVSSGTLSDSSKPTETDTQEAQLQQRRTNGLSMGLLFEVRGEGRWENLCIDTIHCRGCILVEGQVIPLQQEGSLWFSTTPMWLDLSGVVSGGSDEGCATDSPCRYIELEYRLVSSIPQSAGSASQGHERNSHCSVPLERGLWLVSESAAERTTEVSLVSQSTDEALALSPTRSIYTAGSVHSAAIRAAEVDSWAAFMGR
ncbi:Uncharacterized protein SCF082_LOCUS47040, partial [Durusdinium trenchii]